MSSYDTDLVMRIGGFYMIIGILFSLLLYSMPADVRASVVAPDIGIYNTTLVTNATNITPQVTTITQMPSYMDTMFDVFTSMLTMSVSFTGGTQDRNMVNSILNLLFFGPLTFTIGWVILNRLADIAKHLVPFT